MGNLTSCFCYNPNNQTSTLIDVNGNKRLIKLPITAAEIMLVEQPGHLICPVVNDLRSSFRLSALRADEALVKGSMYFLFPVGRLNSFVNESELEMLLAGCKNVSKTVKRHRQSCKVLPVVAEIGGCMMEGGGGGGEEVIGRRMMWKPVLEPIYE